MSFVFRLIIVLFPVFVQATVVHSFRERKVVISDVRQTICADDLVILKVDGQEDGEGLVSEVVNNRVVVALRKGVFQPGQKVEVELRMGKLPKNRVCKSYKTNGHPAAYFKLEDKECLPVPTCNDLPRSCSMQDPDKEDEVECSSDEDDSMPWLNACWKPDCIRVREDNICKLDLQPGGELKVCMDCHDKCKSPLKAQTLPKHQIWKKWYACFNSCVESKGHSSLSMGKYSDEKPEIHLSARSREVCQEYDKPDKLYEPSFLIDGAPRPKEVNCKKYDWEKTSLDLTFDQEKIEEQFSIQRVQVRNGSETWEPDEELENGPRWAVGSQLQVVVEVKHLGSDKVWKIQKEVEIEKIEYKRGISLPTQEFE